MCIHSFPPLTSSIEHCIHSVAYSAFYTHTHTHTQYGLFPIQDFPYFYYAAEYSIIDTLS